MGLQYWHVLKKWSIGPFFHELGNGREQSCSIFLGQEVFGDFLVNDDVVHTAFLKEGEEAAGLGFAGG